MRADFLAEARRIAGQRLRQLVLGEDGVDEFADHGMLGRADEVEILALDLIHHVLHLGEAHHARDHAAADHVRRNVVGKAAVDHEVARIGQAGAVQARDVAFEVVEAVAGGAARGIDVDSVQLLHDIHMIRHLKIRHKRLAEALDFNVLAVILADRHARIDDLRDDLHALLDLGGIFLFQLLQMRQLVGHLVDLRLGRLGLILLSLLHQAADFLGEHFALVAQAVGLLHGLAVLAVQLDHLVNEGELAVLKLLFDVFAHDVRRLADQIDIDHDSSSFLLYGACPENLHAKIKGALLPHGTKCSALPPKLPFSWPLLTDKGRLPASSSPAAWKERINRAPRRLAPPDGSLERKNRSVLFLRPKARRCMRIL